MTVGTLVTLTATIAPSVSGSGLATPTGTVTFYEVDDYGNILQLLGVASVIDGEASLSTSFATTGVHKIKAVYSGDINFDISFAFFDLTVNGATPPEGGGDDQD